jgi:hypothetical protein
MHQVLLAYLQNRAIAHAAIVELKRLFSDAFLYALSMRMAASLFEASVTVLSWFQHSI